MGYLVFATILDLAMLAATLWVVSRMIREWNAARRTRFSIVVCMIAAVFWGKVFGDSHMVSLFHVALFGSILVTNEVIIRLVDSFAAGRHDGGTSR